MRYSSDLTDKKWEIIRPLLPGRKGGGRNPKYSDRMLMNAILYLTTNGIKWRDIPHDLPHWCSVYKYFIKLTQLGTIEKINSILTKKARKTARRNEDPSLLCIDSQSVQGDCVNKKSGYDGNKKVKGSKRHILVDVLGLIELCLVTTANTSDIKAGREMVAPIDEQNLQPRLEKILADGAYQALCDSSSAELEISTKDASINGFVPLRIRWKVERSFAWPRRKRRLNRNYERYLEHHKQFVYPANIIQAFNIMNI